ncbi:putative translation elongation factor P [Carex littledalei]|uniref:Putative translation elongation factor P n=1 Tax=Carex littledalei TaxID=544730 RepID=A0A833QY08_9POAL|nr:putative translation elongation factor P [Carex littledalei]
MQSVRRQAIEALRRRLIRRSPPPFSASSHSFTTLTKRTTSGPHCHATLSAPWAATQTRGAKMLGSDVRLGNVIQRKGRIYQVIKAQHTHQGRGGATVQVELRDVDTGNKTVERFRTDEAIEKVFVEEKTFTFLYKEGDSIMLMEPETFEQLEVSKELFGKSAAYLKEDMPVTLQYYDGRPMSASVPTRVTCTVIEARAHTKGLTAAPQHLHLSKLEMISLSIPRMTPILPGNSLLNS